MPHRLDPCCDRDSIAVLGASERADTVGRTTIENLLPRRLRRSALRSQSALPARSAACPASPRLAALPEAVEHVIFAVSDERVEAALDEAIAHGARAATMMSALVLDQDRDPPLRERVLREDPRRGPRGLRRQRHGLLQFHRPGLGLRLRDPQACAHWQCGLHQSLGLRHVRHRRLRGAHRFQPGGLHRPGTRRHAWTSTWTSPSINRAPAWSGCSWRPHAIPQGLSGPLKRPAAAHPHRGAESRPHRTLGAAHGVAFGRDCRRRRRLSGPVRSLRRAARGRHGSAGHRADHVRAATPGCAGGLVSIHDSGGERQLLIDLAHDAQVPLTVTQ